MTFDLQPWTGFRGKSECVGNTVKAARLHEAREQGSRLHISSMWWWELIMMLSTHPLSQTLKHISHHIHSVWHNNVNTFMCKSNLKPKILNLSTLETHSRYLRSDWLMCNRSLAAAPAVTVAMTTWLIPLES